MCMIPAGSNIMMIRSGMAGIIRRETGEKMKTDTPEAQSRVSRSRRAAIEIAYFHTMNPPKFSQAMAFRGRSNLHSWRSTLPSTRHTIFLNKEIWKYIFFYKLCHAHFLEKFKESHFRFDCFDFSDD